MDNNLKVVKGLHNKMRDFVYPMYSLANGKLNLHFECSKTSRRVRIAATPAETFLSSLIILLKKRQISEWNKNMF